MKNGALTSHARLPVTSAMTTAVQPRIPLFANASSSATGPDSDARIDDGPPHSTPAVSATMYVLSDIWRVYRRHHTSQLLRYMCHLACAVPCPAEAEQRQAESCPRSGIPRKRWPRGGTEALRNIGSRAEEARSDGKFHSVSTHRPLQKEAVYCLREDNDDDLIESLDWPFVQESSCCDARLLDSDDNLLRYEARALWRVRGSLCSGMRSGISKTNSHSKTRLQPSATNTPWTATVLFSRTSSVGCVQPI